MLNMSLSTNLIWQFNFQFLASLGSIVQEEQIFSFLQISAGKQKYK